MSRQLVLLMLLRELLNIKGDSNNKTGVDIYIFQRILALVRVLYPVFV